MHTDIQNLLTILIENETIKDDQLEKFGADITPILPTLSDEDFIINIDCIYNALLNKGPIAYNADVNLYKKIIRIYFMRGVFHCIRLTSKEDAEKMWDKLSQHFKTHHPIVHEVVNHTVNKVTEVNEVNKIEDIEPLKSIEQANTAQEVEADNTSHLVEA